MHDLTGLIRVGSVVDGVDGREAGSVRMVNLHSRLAVLVAWPHGRLEWVDPERLRSRQRAAHALEAQPEGGER